MSLRPAAFNETHCPPSSQVALTLAPAYLEPINTHPKQGEGHNRKLYGSGTHAFPSPAQKKGKGQLREITLHVGLPHTAPHTNTNFRLTFLLTQLQEALYNHFPGLCFIAEVNFWCLPKTVVSCDSFIIIVIIIFFRQVFSESTEAIATSFLPLVTNFSEICAFIVGFS